jgi:hypothetical protein
MFQRRALFISPVHHGNAGIVWHNIHGSIKCFFGQLLDMASRAIFDPASCFPAANPLFGGQAPNAKDSPARKISEYLEIVPIEGKGFGTVARKDVDAYILLFGSHLPPSPAQISWIEIERWHLSDGHIVR